MERHILTSVTGFHWSSDRGQTWHERDDRTIGMVRVRLRALRHLDKQTAARIAELITSQEQPFLSLGFLYAAERLDDDPFSWVLATTAAELAIKEALIRLRPELATLLLEMPSPPLRKLYGQVLQEIVGERSPHLSALDSGSVMRNNLVHRPGTVVDPQKAVDYMAMVGSAIRHLILLCRRRLLLAPNQRMDLSGLGMTVILRRGPTGASNGRLCADVRHTLAMKGRR